MQLINHTQDIIICSEISIADSLVRKSVGLIGATHPKCLYFQTRLGIHTFGVKVPLTVLICDNDLTVRLIKHKLLPNRVFFWDIRWNNVIELPDGDYPVVVGDRLLIK